ncbi:helix-turn-helix protein [compost metagenome]
MNINQLTASRIKELRAKNNLTAEAVAQSLDISKSAYSQMENGHVEITLSRIQLLAEIFHVTVGDIIPSSTTNHQTFSGNNGGINGNNNNNANNTNTFNNFFSNNEENLDAMLKVVKDVLQGKTNQS